MEQCVTYSQDRIYFGSGTKVTVEKSKCNFRNGSVSVTQYTS